MNDYTNFSPDVASFFKLTSDTLQKDAAGTELSLIWKEEGLPKFRDNFSQCQKAITQVIEDLKNTALILGAGGLNDIPVESLSERFDSIVLVDASLEHTALALEALSAPLKNKFSLMQVDLTGFFNELSDKTKEIDTTNLPYDEFISKVLDVLPTLTRQELNFSNVKPSFISSSLLCSQLAAGTFDFLDNLALNLYKKNFKAPYARADEFDNWLAQIQINHLNDLSKLIDEKGKIYFSDHFSVKYVSYKSCLLKITKNIISECSFPGAEKVSLYLTENYSVLGKDEWTWSFPQSFKKKVCVVTNEDGTQQLQPLKVWNFKELQITSLVLTPKSKKELS